MEIKNDECRMQNYDGEKLINYRWTEEDFEARCNVACKFYGLILVIVAIIGIIDGIF